jgi:hypothetical protein
MEALARRSPPEKSSMITVNPTPKMARATTTSINVNPLFRLDRRIFINLLHLEMLAFQVFNSTFTIHN